MDDPNTDPKPRKLTKAECGRLGGNTTKARHGREHYVRAGKLGFAKLAKSLGYMCGSRLGALQQLRRAGKMRDTPEQARAQAEASAWAESYLDEHGVEPEASDHD